MVKAVVGVLGSDTALRMVFLIPLKSAATVCPRSLGPIDIVTHILIFIIMY